MTKSILTTTICASLLLLNACGSRQQTDSQHPDSTGITVKTSSSTSSEAPITERLIELGLTSNSDWRGINLGDDFSEVKTAEKGENFESDAKHTGYTVDLKNLQTADNLYYQKDGKVFTIDVDLFLNSRQAVTDYQKELTAYFSARYGTPKPGAGGFIWSGQAGKTVALKDVSKGKDFGLKVSISSAGGSATASAK